MDAVSCDQMSLGTLVCLYLVALEGGCASTLYVVQAFARRVKCRRVVSRSWMFFLQLAILFAGFCIPIVLDLEDLVVLDIAANAFPQPK